MKFLLLLAILLAHTESFGKTFFSSSAFSMPAFPKNKDISSGIIYIERDGETILSRSFGYADYLHQSPFTPITQIYIGSLKKQFIAAAILKLMNEGKLKLNDPVDAYIQFNTSLNPIDSTWPEKTTLHHLLTHTSGVRRKAQTDQTELTYLDLVYLNSTSPKEMPTFTYSSAAFALLEEVIEVVSGQSFQSYITQNFLIPTGMNHTTFHGPTTPHTIRQNICPTLCYPYHFFPSQSIVVSSYLPHQKRAFGKYEMISTAKDLCLWNTALYSGKVFKTTPEKAAQLLLLMKGLYTPDEEGDSYYGYGIKTYIREKQVVYWHEGLVTGASVYLEYTPQTNTHLVILSNNSGISFNAKTGSDVLQNLIKYTPPE